ncbi:penicillin acylase family protein [Luminiphilus sp.]|nr:penicillin acylase family protein [Luminiphilus sp.]
MQKFITVLILATTLSGLSDSVTAWEAEIERDIWGVPHIKGVKDADVAYGLGYAMAEDTWKVIEAMIPYYRANAGSYFGPEAAKQDYIVHWLGLWDDLDLRYESDLKPETREYVEAYAAGITRYATEHPEAVSLDVLPLTGKDVIAGHMLRHPLFYGFQSAVTELLGDTRARPVATAGSVTLDEQPVGSNAIAVGPKRSADGSTMLVINSHQPLTGPVAWYEAHLQSESGLNVMGGLFPGAPAIGVGFTPETAWGATVNKPDLVDVFVLDIDPDNENRYRLDDQWLDLEQKSVKIKVLIWGFIPWSVTETVYRSVHGPVLKTPHGTYAVRYAGMGELKQVEQWRALNRARSFEAWQDAMALNHIQSFNFVYAGQAGNIHFIHNAQMPIRAPGWDWSQYLPGDRSDLIWKSYYDTRMMPQITNPDSGFVLSTNQSPFAISATGSNPDPAIVAADGGWQTRMTNRAVRGLALFAAHDTVSEQQLLDIKHDHTYDENYRGMDFLREVAALQLIDPQMQEAQRVLIEWDRATDKGNQNAPLGVCILAESGGTPVPDAEVTLRDCIDQIFTMTGRLRPTWGEVNRHGRGDTHYAMAGGPDTLRAAYAAPSKEDKTFNRVTGGDGLYYLVRWDASGKQSIQGTHQYGNHFDDPLDPHFHDQTEDFANEVLHKALFRSRDRATLVERRYRISSDD